MEEGVQVPSGPLAGPYRLGESTVSFGSIILGKLINHFSLASVLSAAQDLRTVHGACRAWPSLRCGEERREGKAVLAVLAPPF